MKFCEELLDDYEDELAEILLESGFEPHGRELAYELCEDDFGLRACKYSVEDSGGPASPWFEPWLRYGIDDAAPFTSPMDQEPDL